MLFRQLYDNASSTYTYLLAKDYGQQAIIIDPVQERYDLYLQLIDEFGLTLKMIIDTHVHADHVTAAGRLKDHFHCDYVMGEKSKANGVTKQVKDNEQISVDELTLTTLYTPGHTDDSYSFAMHDRVFTGDALLIRGTGRTDFQNGSNDDAYHSLFDKLLQLPDSTLIYPAHDYKGMMVSTIGEEKQFNPRLQVHSVAEYSQIMDNLKLAKPKLFDVAVPANLNAGL